LKCKCFSLAVAEVSGGGAGTVWGAQASVSN